MSVKNTRNQDENSSNLWFYLLLVVAIIVGLYYYFKSVVSKANEDLGKHLEEKKKSLDNIYDRIEYYRKRKVEVLSAERKTKVFLRVLVALILCVLNWLYLAHCQPKELTIQHFCECVTTLNAVLFFFAALLGFVLYGNFFEIKSAYYLFEAYVLRYLFKESKETIEMMLRLDLENREAIKKEISETEAAIKANVALMHQPIEQELPFS